MTQEILEERFTQLKFFDKGLISLKETASNLKLSIRQVQRLLKKLRQNHFNPQALIRVKGSAWNKSQDEVRDKVVLLHNQRPARSNPAIAELLQEQDIQVSPSTVRRIRVSAGLYKQSEIEKRFFKKFEAKKFGHLLQMDTMSGYWLGQLTKLILILDDYSRAILAFNWVPADTSWQNMCLLRQIVQKYGKPAVVYTDNDSKFRTIRHKRSMYHNYKDEDYETQINRALREMEIALVNHPPYQAFCKGKVERLFRFIQDRFLPEMKAKNFKDLNQEFKQWVKWYNTNHVNRMTKVRPKERFLPSGFKPLTRKEDLDFIFSLRDERKIDKYNSFSFNGKRYFLKSKVPLWGTKVTLALNPTHRIKVYRNAEFLQEFRLKN